MRATLNTLQRLSIVRDLQEQYPKLVLGGSLALWLYGIDLERDGDIDMMTPEPFPSLELIASNGYKKRDKNREGFSDEEDFDSYEKDGIHIDFRIEEVEWIEIKYRSTIYKVEDLSTILKYKHEYAFDKGVDKHRVDYEKIKKILRIYETKNIGWKREHDTETEESTQEKKSY